MRLLPLNHNSTAFDFENSKLNGFSLLGIYAGSDFEYEKKNGYDLKCDGNAEASPQYIRNALLKSLVFYDVSNNGEKRFLPIFQISTYWWIIRRITNFLGNSEKMTYNKAPNTKKAVKQWFSKALHILSCPI